jgi:hypothetical protein
MLPGYLHFDLRRGLRADMLNAAMSQFLPSHESIRQAFDSLDLKEISWEFVDDTSESIKGRVVQFYVNNILVTHNKITNIAKKHKSTKAIWDTNNQDIYKISSNLDPQEKINNYFIKSCLNQERISLNQIRKIFAHPSANLELAGVSLEILSNLECDLFVEQKLNGPDALWLLCNLIMLVALVAALDPKFLSATKIYVSSSTKDSQMLQNTTWLHHILRRVPTVEVDQNIEFDVLAAAFIKTLVGQFGPRGDSSVVSMSIGLSNSCKAYIECLWCEARFPDTISEIGINNKARLHHLYEVAGLVTATTDIVAFVATLSLHGAVSISYFLVHGEKQSTTYFVRFLVTHERYKEAVEAFLIKASAEHVTLKAVESHELAKRLVSVPLGHGNKMSAYRFYEYIYYERCVRVEPVQEDLNLYVKKTNYSVDVARSDLLMAWKKWRGQAMHA